METFKMIQEAYKDKAMNRMCVCLSRIKHSLMTKKILKTKPRVGRPISNRTNINVANQRQNVNYDCQLKDPLITQQLNSAKSIGHSIVTDI